MTEIVLERTEGMSPKEIMDAIAFMNNAKDNLCKGDDLYEDYKEQIKFLLKVQRIMAYNPLKYTT
jgi:hypothetical protein